MPENERTGLTRDEMFALWNRIDNQIDAEVIEPECGLWWILSTLTTAAFIGLAFGLLLWLALG